MATNPTPTELAIRDVARHALAATVRRNPPEWEDYPDVGEHGWAAVEREVDRLTERLAPQTEKYECAYRHLADLADASGEG